MVAKQTKELAQEVIKGANSLVKRAEKELSLAKRSGRLSFASDLSLPLTQAISALTLQGQGDLEQALVLARGLIGAPPGRRLWLPYLGETLDAGIAALMTMEVLEFLSLSAHEVSGPQFPDIDLAAEHGKRILEGAGVALILGAGHDSSEAAELISEIKGRHDYVFMAGAQESETLAQQLEKEGLTLGWAEGLVFLGRRTSGISHALGFFTRIALSEGLLPGQAREILQFVRDRIHAFMIVLGEPDRERYAAIAGAVSFGIQTAASFYIPQLLPIYPLA